MRSYLCARSYLYVPADQPTKLTKALTSGADAIIFDLEDAVAVANKDVARSVLCEFLLAQRPGVSIAPASDGPASDAPASDRPALWVRINDGQRGLDDVRAVTQAAAGSLDGICVPKATMEKLRAVDGSLTEIERFSSLPAGDTAVCALLESAAAVLDARMLATGPRVIRLAIGEADLSAELGTALTPGDEREHLLARQMLVLASAAAGLDAPTGPVSTDFRDLEAFRSSTVALKQMGFRGRAAIHPAQVAVINEVFTPSEKEVVVAARVIELFDASVERGDGVCTDDDGHMVDEAIVRSARRTLATVRAGLPPVDLAK